MKKILWFLPILLLMISCSDKERFIDDFDETNKVLLAVNTESTASLQYIDLVDGTVISTDVYLTANGTSLDDTVSNLKIFRDNIFVFLPNTQRIIVIGKNDFKKIADIDFSAENLEPTDIAFANATDAYIAHGNSNKVTLLDLTNFQKAREITVGKNPVAITASGNQIYTANYGDNTVSVIDSRTNREEAKINVSPKPKFIDIRSNGKEVLAVSEGLGKNGIGTKTAAIATFIDVATRNILKETPIGNASINAVDIVPFSLAITNKDYAFIPTQENFMKISMRTRTSVSSVGKFKYQNVRHNNYAGHIVAISEDNGVSKAIICNSITGRKIYEAQIPNGTRCFLSIY